MDQTASGSRGGVLQLDAGGGLGCAGTGDRFDGLAIPARGAETERDVVAAPYCGMPLRRTNRGGLVVTLPREAPGRATARLSTGAGGGGSVANRANGALGWVSERR